MKYLLTFKPLKNFFFGNNKTFSNDYVAHSEYFPQNTQLLGALKIFLAEQKGLMHIHKNGRYSNNPASLTKLIGNASSKDYMTNDNLGLINNISQMFIVNKSITDAFFPTPFDIEILEKEVNYYELTNIDQDYFYKNFSVKDVSSQSLAGNDFWKKYLKKETLDFTTIHDFDTVFKKHSQVGIGLENKQVVDKAFYVKEDYNLDSEYLFACVFDFDETIEDGIIQLGAESSLFSLKVSKLESTEIANHTIVSQFFTQDIQGEKLIAMSDIILNSTHELNTYFSHIPFTKKLAMLQSGNRYTNSFKGKTLQTNVIPQGSVFYLKSQREILQKGAYNKMGYNQFIKVKK